MKLTKKTNVVFLLVACITCFLFAVGLSLSHNAYAVGETLTVTDDFTTLSNGQKSNAYSQSNLVYDANETYGAVTGSSWRANVSGGDAQLVYKLSSDDGYVLNTSNLTFTVGSGHGSGVYWYNTSHQGTSNNVLGNNLIVSVSTDNETWVTVYNLDEREHPTRNAQDYFSNKYNPSIDLSDYLVNAVDLYVKFDIEHFTVEECCIDIDSWKNGIPLNQVGLGMYSVNLSATQKEISDLTLSSDFTSAGLTAASNNVFENNNVTTDANGHATYGLIPAEKWGASVKLLSDAYVTYKLNAVNGYALSSLNVDLDVAFGHCSIAMQAVKTDVVVAVSYDNVYYKDVYSLRQDATAVAVGESEPKGAGITETDKRYELELDLTDKISATSQLYVRIKIVSPNYSELTEEGLATDTEQNKIVPLGKVGSRLYKVEIQAKQSKIPSVNLSNDWKQAGTMNSFEGVVDYSGVVKDTTNGNTTFGLIPSETWGDPVNISTGYVTYRISATDNYVFSSLVLDLSVRYGTSKDSFKSGNADLTVYTAYDGINFAKTFSLFEKDGIPNSPTEKDFSVDLTSVAKNYGVIYVKIAMECPETEGINLYNLPVCLLGAGFKATQGFASAEGFSFENEFGNDKGTAITDNYYNVHEISNVYDGNATFGLIPSNGWAGEVDAASGYITFKIQAPSDKSLNNARLQLAFKLLSGANVIVSTSYDGSSFAEFYNVADKLGANAYNNSLSWTKGLEPTPYQTLDIDLKAVAESTGTLYVKIAMEHPTGKYFLGNLLCEIFSVKFSGVYSDYAANVGRIIYNLNGGSYESLTNPETYTVGDDIVLVNPVQKYKKFKGWYDNALFDGEPITSIDTSVISVYRLYAKWEQAKYDLDIRISGNGTLSVGGVATESGIKTVDAATTLKFTLAADTDSIIYSLNIDGTDVFLTDGASYTLRNIAKNSVIIATFNERATLNGDFHIDYTDNVKYGNNWKNGLYDFANLYITDDDKHALGINGGQGFLVYKFETPDGKYFESATLTTNAKLFDNYLLGDVEKVDYYVSYDNSDYFLVYKSAFNRKGENYVTVVQNLTEYVIGRQNFFLKIEIGSNSTNWTLVNCLDMAFTYETVELTVNYGGFYTDINYEQFKGCPLDSNIIKPREGYVLADGIIYTDENYNDLLDLTANITSDTVLYVKTVEADGRITYHLDGGVNSQNNPEIYDSSSAIILADPVKEGSVFGGWYTDSSFVNLITEIAKGRTGDLTLYAKWISTTPPDIDYFGTVTYVLDGGVNDKNNPDKYLYGETYKLYDAVKDGYEFLGWYKENSDTRLTEISSESTGDLTLYAKWKKIETENGGGGCRGSIDTCLTVASVMFVIGGALVVKKKFGKN